MKAVITGIVCRALAYIAVLTFVFGLIYMSKNYNYLWFLFLLITCEFVPTYTCTKEYKECGEEKKENG